MICTWTGDLEGNKFLVYFNIRSKRKKEKKENSIEKRKRQSCCANIREEKKNFSRPEGEKKVGERSQLSSSRELSHLLRGNFSLEIFQPRRLDFQ